MTDIYNWVKQLPVSLKLLIGGVVSIHILGIIYLLYVHFRDSEKNIAEFSTKIKNK